MKRCLVIFTLLSSIAYGFEATKLKAVASRIDGEADQFAYKIEYESEHAAQLGVNKGKILRQRIVRFYNEEAHVGSYFYWQEVGSHLPSAITSADLMTKPSDFTQVRISDRFYDVNWRDGRWTEAELSKWFTQTWHLFNSCNPSKGSGEYYLCALEEVPRMDGYLRGTGFTVYAVLEHSFTLSKSK